MGEIKAVGRYIGGLTPNAFKRLIEKASTNIDKAIQYYTRTTAGKYRIIMKGIPIKMASVKALFYIEKFLNWFTIKKIEHQKNGIDVIIDNNLKKFGINQCFFYLLLERMFENVFRKKVSIIIKRRNKTIYEVEIRWKGSIYQ